MKKNTSKNHQITEAKSETKNKGIVEHQKNIKHDVNNAISNIQGAIYLLKDEVDNNEDAKHLIEVIRFHDIGKIAIDDAIQNKQEPLTKTEKEQ